MTDLRRFLAEGIVLGDAADLIPRLGEGAVDLFLTSPPYADQRAYLKVPPDGYVEWFLPYAEAMLAATTATGSLALNIKNKVADAGPLKGQRHPYVYQLTLALQGMGWRWIETYIWAKPNAVPGSYGPRTKDAFEYVHHFAKGVPYFDVDAVREPYKTDADDIQRRTMDLSGRKVTEAGFGRDRAGTYLKGGADPGNVITVPQTYNQHHSADHPAAMPERLAEFFVKAMSPVGGVVVDPFAGSGTTVTVATRHGRRAAGFELNPDYVATARRRLRADRARGLQLNLPGL